MKSQTQETEVCEFNIQDLLPIAMIFIVLGIAVAYGLDVMGDIKTDAVTATTHCGLNSSDGTAGVLLYDGCGAEYNATGKAMDAVAKIPDKLPMIITVVIAAVIIGILMTYLVMRQK